MVAPGIRATEPWKVRAERPGSQSGEEPGLPLAVEGLAWEGAGGRGGDSENRQHWGDPEQAPLPPGDLVTRVKSLIFGVSFDKVPYAELCSLSRSEPDLCDTFPFLQHPSAVICQSGLRSERLFWNFPLCSSSAHGLYSLVSAVCEQFQSRKLAANGINLH